MDPKNLILGEASLFVESEIMQQAVFFEENEEIPRDLINKMGTNGYLGANFPIQYGGLGLDPVLYGQLTEIIGKGCSSVRSMMTVHASLVGESLLRFGTEEQKDSYLPLMAKGEILAAFALSEPEVGSDAKNIRTSYKRLGDDFIINGAKKWITLAGIADVFLVIATNEVNTTAFLVPSDHFGITVKPMKGLMAGKASHVAEIHFNDCLLYTSPSPRD